MTDGAIRPVRITGWGVVSTHGSGMEALWDAAAKAVPAGRMWSPDDEPDQSWAAPIPDDYRAHPEIPRNLAHFLDRGSLMAVDAALQALASAGLGAGAGDARRFGVVDGLAYRAPGQPTLYVPYGHVVARALGVRGPVLTVGGNEASGLSAVAAAVRLIETGQADVVVAGASQALQRPVLAHFAAQGLAATEASKPFDATHAGMTPGEGAAYVIVESEAHAKVRGATSGASIAGIAHEFDPGAEPLATSDATEAGRVMTDALAAAGFVQNQVDLVVSCADGRVTTDFSEGYGIQRTFGRHAYFASVTTVAGTAGCTLAASGVMSLAMGLEAMQRGAVWPIAGFEKQEAELELNYARDAKPEKEDCVLVTSLGLGGTNVSILLQKV